MIKFLDLKAQYESIKQEIDAAIRNVIDSSAFIGGNFVRAFEEEFAQYQEARYCVGVANGTDALEIAIESLDLPRGSEIIVPANSFIASSEAVTRSGHKVVFCDCNEENFTISIPSLKSKLTKNTSAVVAVHLYGHPCDMDPLLELSKSNKIKIIEDCAQAHGAEYKGRRVGALGDIGTFSFYPGKNLGAYGDAGAILTNSEVYAKKCKMIANHGRIEKYCHEFEGRNSRLDGIQAAILSVKLKHLDAWTKLRIDLADTYYQRLNDFKEIRLPHRENWAKHVYHLFVVKAKNRDALSAFLKSSNIQTGIHYPLALPKQPAYRYCKQMDEILVSNSLDVTLLSLPIGEHLTKESIAHVCDAIRTYYNN